MLEQLVKSDLLSVELASKYLNIYIGQANWSEKISQMWNIQSKKNGPEKAKEFIKKSVSCACLSPLINKVNIPDEKHVLLFWVSGWPQFNERDWFSLFKETVKNDIEIGKKRKLVLQEGLFDHIDIPPLTRQAYNWLYDNMSKEKFGSNSEKEEAIEKLKNMVRIYGGAVICNLFTNHSNSVEKILNWRSGYFLEKEIYKVYSVEQIIKIKKMEIKKTNTNFIKKIDA